ncbi:BrnT family toxin [Marimonas sp. MJW-29]|uniref:BrnT family toxin n=1 Tax=Sulfitobacter sediminis TaxID=3234186 RepID=A0ABV3RIS2_9RHOB
MEWDEEKRQQTLFERGIDFAIIARLDWDTAEVIADDRRDYGEQRLRVTGLIEGRLHVAVVTPRPDALRVISLRKANEREKRRWARNT